MNRERYLQEIDAVNAAGKYHPTWESLSTHPVPDWYREKRLGIFLHWGVFSVPAYHDWYARNMYIKGSPEYEYHCQHYGQPKDFGFKDFIPQFKMEAFDPQAWVKLFREAGADYIVPVAEHHDGFQNYRSELSHWNAAEMGPHRDIMGDLLVEAERAGMTLGASSHRVEHWWFLGHGQEFDSDIKQPMHLGDYAWPAMPERENQDLFSEPMPTDEFLTDWLLRCCEIVDRYHPRILYFDWWIQHSAVKPYLQRFAAYYFNVMESRGGCVINYKHDAFPFGIGVPDIERGQFAEAKPFLWQSDTSVMRGSWCYSVQPDKAVYKAPQEIVQDLLDVVSKNGRLLLSRTARWRTRTLKSCTNWRTGCASTTSASTAQACGASIRKARRRFRRGSLPTARPATSPARTSASPAAVETSTRRAWRARRTASCTFGLCARRTRATCRSGTALCGRWRCWAIPRRSRGRATAKPCMWI